MSNTSNTFDNKTKQLIDSYVEEVLTKHPIYTRLKKQVNKGIRKYDEPVNPSSYSMLGWFNHLQDELTDGITYNEILMLKLEEVIKSLEIAYKHSNDEIVRIHVLNALTILRDGNDNQ